MPTECLTLLDHPRLGRCELLRVEGTNWVLRRAQTGGHIWWPSSRRGEFQVLQTSAPSPANGPVTQPRPSVSPSPGSDHRARFRVIESIRNGLPPVDGEAQHLAVGMERTIGEIDQLLEQVTDPRGSAMVIRGAYGQGKTFALSILEERALAAGYLVTRTEIDAQENRLDKPHCIYRDLMGNLRIPGTTEQGARALARVVVGAIQQETYAATDLLERASNARIWLRRGTQCEPLAWLLSDPRLLERSALLGLLGCEPGIRVSAAREASYWKSLPRDWPAFSAGTQGDFACYLFSGIGRLARLLGHKGLVVILDEMEKWQDLNWQAQSRAGNLLGGLIWGATAEEGQRYSQHKPQNLWNSGRCGGYPFTTPGRCHLGIAIAMTPRGDSGPEREWSQYGPFQEVDLPQLSAQMLATYVARIAPLYAGAYSLSEPSTPDVTRSALTIWRRRGDESFRTAVQSVVEALDAWRDANHSDSSSE